MSDEPNESADFGLLMPFWIDTDAYTDRDRQMFVAGVEFQMVYDLLSDGWSGRRTIHRENESRVRMLCGKLKIPCEIRPVGYQGYEEWAELVVPER